MKRPADLPQHVARLDKTETFSFSCHKKVKCFTDCCRMLELALSPYDVLRLRQATGLSSNDLLEKYIIVEHDPGELFPRLYLTMIDDGRASCVFVSGEGCTVYNHRPAACRAYPLGRAVMRCEDGRLEEHFVLMKEAHCQGFDEPVEQTALQYSREQELLTYNRFNDAMASILQHESIRQGFIPSAKQIDLFILSLYNIDTFKEMVLTGQLKSPPLPEVAENSLQSDEALLLFAIKWLKEQLFVHFDT